MRRFETPILHNHEILESEQHQRQQLLQTNSEASTAARGSSARKVKAAVSWLSEWTGFPIQMIRFRNDYFGLPDLLDRR